MEPGGVEPPTSCMPCKRATNCAMAPEYYLGIYIYLFAKVSQKFYLRLYADTHILKMQEQVNNKTIEKDILIIGAGISGLALANSLAQQGIDFDIIDKAKPELYKSTSTIQLTPLTLETLQTWGVASKVLTLGHRINYIQFFSERDLLLSADLTKTNSRFNFRLAINKAEIYNVLAEKIKQRKIEVNWQTKLLEIKQADGICHVKLKTAEHENITYYKYVIITANDEDLISSNLPSWKLDEKFSGLWAGATLKVKKDWPFSDDGESVFYSSQGALIITPTAKSECEIWYQESASNPPALSEASLAEVVASRTKREAEFLNSNISSYKPIPVRNYQNYCRSKYNDGAIFLLGEAAHMHNPLGMSEINTFIGDAINLAWKLKAALSGIKHIELLSSYEFERKKSFNATVNLAKNILTPAKLVAGGKFRNALANVLLQTTASLLSNFSQFSQNSATNLSGFTINYHDSFFSEENRRQEASFLEDNFTVGSYITDLATNESKAEYLFDEINTGNWLLCILPEVGLSYKRMSYKLQKAKSLIDKLAVPMQIALIADRKFKEKVKGLYFDENRAIRRHFGVIDEGVFIIRPDRHLGYRANAVNFESIKSYLEKLRKEKNGSGGGT